MIQKGRNGASSSVEESDDDEPPPLVDASDSSSDSDSEFSDDDGPPPLVDDSDSSSDSSDDDEPPPLVDGSSSSESESEPESDSDESEYSSSYAQNASPPKAPHRAKSNFEVMRSIHARLRANREDASIVESCLDQLCAACKQVSPRNLPRSLQIEIFGTILDSMVKHLPSRQIQRKALKYVGEAIDFAIIKDDSILFEGIFLERCAKAMLASLQTYPGDASIYAASCHWLAAFFDHAKSNDWGKDKCKVVKNLIVDSGTVSIFFGAIEDSKSYIGHPTVKEYSMFLLKEFSRKSDIAKHIFVNQKYMDLLFSNGVDWEHICLFCEHEDFKAGMRIVSYLVHALASDETVSSALEHHPKNETPNVFRAFDLLVGRSRANADMIVEANGVKAICRIFRESKDPACMEWGFSALASLLYEESEHFENISNDLSSNHFSALVNNILETFAGNSPLVEQACLLLRRLSWADNAIESALRDLQATHSSVIIAGRACATLARLVDESTPNKERALDAILRTISAFPTKKYIFKSACAVLSKLGYENGASKLLAKAPKDAVSAEGALKQAGFDATVDEWRKGREAYCSAQNIAPADKMCWGCTQPLPKAKFSKRQRGGAQFKLRRCVDCANAGAAFVLSMDAQSPKDVFDEIKVASGEMITQICGHADDACSICLDKWNGELKSDVCVVLRCGHALCFKCMRNVFKASQEMNETDTGERNYTSFSCPQCRRCIALNEMTRVKDEVFRALYSGGLQGVAMFIPVDELQRKKIVERLLVSCDYEMEDVSRRLHKMGLAFFKEASDTAAAIQASLREKQKRAEAQRRDKKELQRGIDASYHTKYAKKRVLGTQDKQSIYKNAYAAVDRLQALLDKEGISEQEKARIKKELKKAHKDAQAEIMQNVNDAADMGARMNEWKFDFHGASVPTVLERMQAYEDCINEAPGNQITIVTGKGNHSARGFSVVKDTVVEFCRKSEIIGAKTVEGNAGELLIFSRKRHHYYY